MRIPRVLYCLAGLLVGVAGCPTASQTTVLLVNNGDFTVRAEVVYNGEQDTPRDLLESTGTLETIEIPAGQTRSLTRDCDELQAVIIRNAELRVIGSIGPEASSDVQRDGSDFGCGDTVTFTFDHGLALLDFDVTP